MVIIGITGTIGAGKGTIVDYLTSKKNFKHHSVRSYLLNEIKKRNLEPNRDSMVLVANQLRESHTPSFIIDELTKEAVKNHSNSVIESIRTEGEVLSLRKYPNFYLFAVDALPEIRYQRIVLRSSETDNIDYQTFIQNEKREFTSANPNNQNLKRCIELSDFKFVNNGSIQELYNQIENVLSKLTL
ncbi:MAG: AAA family ATPase [Bacteroidales bacterium]|nr:AAA family ATPase [Bacteroidales bacterium]MDD4210096.1 AAA family ATPase [Bacteroidales bacterium]